MSEMYVSIIVEAKLSSMLSRWRSVGISAKESTVKGEEPVGVDVEPESVSETPVMSEPDWRVMSAGENVVRFMGSSKVSLSDPDVTLRENDRSEGVEVSGVIVVTAKAEFGEITRR